MVNVPFPRTVMAHWIALALGVVLWLAATADVVSRQLSSPSRYGVVMCVVLVLGPLLAAVLPRIPIYLFAAYAALVPFDNLLATGTGSSLTKFVGIAAACSLVASMVFGRRTIAPSRSILLIAALTIYAGLTVFWALDVRIALNVYGNLLNYALLYVIVALYRVRASDLRIVVAAVIAGALVAAGYSLVLFHNGAQATEDVRIIMKTASDNFIDPNEAAATMLTPLSITLLLFLYAKTGLKKIGYLLLFCAIFAGFVVSGSRGATIAFAMVSVFVLLRGRNKLQMLGMLAVAGAAIAASPVAQRIIRPDALSGNGRTDIWKVGIAALHQYWLFGAGPGNFEKAFNQYYLSVYHVLLPWNFAAHSLFLRSAVEYGIGGSLLVLFLWYALFHDLSRAERDPRLGALALALRASVLGLFAAGFSLDLLMYKYTWLTFCLIALTRSAFVLERRATIAAEDAARAA